MKRSILLRTMPSVCCRRGGVGHSSPITASRKLTNFSFILILNKIVKFILPRGLEIIKHRKEKILRTFCHGRRGLPCRVPNYPRITIFSSVLFTFTCIKLNWGFRRALFKFFIFKKICMSILWVLIFVTLCVAFMLVCLNLSCIEFLTKNS